MKALETGSGTLLDLCGQHILSLWQLCSATGQDFELLPAPPLVIGIN